MKARGAVIRGRGEGGRGKGGERGIRSGVLLSLTKRKPKGIAARDIAVRVYRTAESYKNAATTTPR